MTALNNTRFQPQTVRRGQTGWKTRADARSGGRGVPRRTFRPPAGVRVPYSDPYGPRLFPYMNPNVNFAASLIMAGPHTGSHTS
jgi:hypothetical protein